MRALWMLSIVALLCAGCGSTRSQAKLTPEATALLDMLQRDGHVHLISVSLVGPAQWRVLTRQGGEHVRYTIAPATQAMLATGAPLHPTGAAGEKGMVQAGTLVLQRDDGPVVYEAAADAPPLESNAAHSTERRWNGG